MDERERMRAGLAEKAMGWTVDDSHFGYYRNANGGTIGTPHNGDLTRDDWQPDESWEQCGLVIEAMRAQGWRLSVLDVDLEIDLEIWEIEWRHEAVLSKSRTAAMTIVERGTSFCAAVSLAAFRALEATDD